MCLLINHPATTEFTFDDIEDFYLYNGDGLGVMYAEDNTLHVQKLLPDSAIEAYEFYVKHCVGRECVIHFRMQTHGDIDTTNCHPYEVFGDGSEMPMYLAHNGILHTGNSTDTKLSDTWHYINDFIKPLLKADPELAFHPSFIELVENHIGVSNKFIMMNYEGRISIVNESAFVKYKGAMLSNTYAWNASRGGYGSKWASGIKGYSKYPAFGRFGGYETDGYEPYYPTTHASTAPKATVHPLDRSRAGDAEFELDPVGLDPDDLDGGDDELFAQLLFEALDEARLHVAYKGVTWGEATEYFDAVGEDEAYKLIDDIEALWVDDMGVINQINQALLAACIACG